MLEKAIAECRKLASEHYGSAMFFDEDKMVFALIRRGYSAKIATDAVNAVTSPTTQENQR